MTNQTKPKNVYFEKGTHHIIPSIQHSVKDKSQSLKDQWLPVWGAERDKYTESSQMLRQSNCPIDYNGGCVIKTHSMYKEKALCKHQTW